MIASKQVGGSLARAWVLLLLLGIGLTTFGLHSLANSSLAGNWRWSLDYISIFLLFALVVSLVGVWRGTLVAGIFTGLVVALTGGILLPVFVVIVMALSAYALGRQLFPSSDVAISDCLLAGLVVFGTVFSLMAHFPVNNAGTWGLIIAVPLLTGRRQVGILLQTRISTVPDGLHLYALHCAICAIALLHFSVSLMPETGHDALATHLFVPSYIAYFQQWDFDVSTYVWAVMPMFADWLYTAGYLLAGETGARLINFGGILLLAVYVYRCAVWIGAGGVLALWAVLIFLSTPLTYTESSSLFIEATWSVMVVGGVLALLRLTSSPKNKSHDLLLGGIFLGGALAAKAVTLTVLPIMALVFVMSARRWFSANLFRTLATSLVAFMIIGLIPYIRAWILTGNPVFPFFNALFQSPFYPAINFNPPAIFERGVQWDTLYRMTFDSGKYLEATPGAAGFQWLILLVPSIIALVLVRNWRALLVAGIAAIALWISFEQTAYLRYVFPSFALICTVIAAALSSVQASGDRWAWRFGVMAVVVVLILNLMHLNAGTYYGEINFRVISDARERDAYIGRALPIRAAVDQINALNRQHTPVAFFSQPMTAGLKANALYVNWYNSQFAAQVLAVRDVDQLGRLLSRHDVEYVVLDDQWQKPAIRQLVQSATTEISRIDSISIRRLNDAYRFTEELLSSPTFQRSDDWYFATGARLLPDVGAVVSVTSPAYTTIMITPGRLYRYTADARCYDDPGQGRLQVNWLNADGQIIRPDIQVFDCTSEMATHSMDIRAPADAVKAVVYASGHTSQALLFSRISFRN